MQSRWTLAIPALMFAGVAAAAPPQLSDFARHAQYTQVKISPEGDYLAASAIVGDQTVLSLIHLSDMKGVNVVPRNNDDLTGFAWVAPHRLMYNVGERFGGLEAPLKTGDLYAVNADGKDAAILFGYRAGDQGDTHIAHATSEMAYGSLITALRDDANHALIASEAANGSTIGVFTQAYKINLETGVKARVAIAPMHNASFLADHTGHVRFAYGVENDQKIKVYYRASDDADWELVSDEAKNGQRDWPLMFNRDNKQVYFQCAGNNGAGGLCKWDVSTRKMNHLWDGNGADVTGLMLTFGGQDAFAVQSQPGRPAVTLLDKSAPEATLLVALMQQFPGEDVEFVSSTWKGDKAIVLVSSDTDPGAFYLYDAQKKKASFLLARRGWIKPAQMASMQPVEFAARDGLKLHGYLTRPVDKADAKNLPLVVLVHGGPYELRDDWDFDPTVQVLASRGYAVLQVNYRGSGGYGFDFVKAGYHEWGGKMQDDVTDATLWAVKQGIADAKRICIFGGSYGGYAALEAAVKEPDLYKCAIGYVGVYDLRLMYSRGEIQQSEFGENYLKTVIGTNPDELWNRSPAAHLDKLKAAVMLIVGGADKRVPPIQGESLHAALEKHHIKHEWLYQRTEAHGFYNPAHVTDMYQKVLAFLDSQIGVAH
ncbi:MAG TPA: S9 family peptidase [Rudaea sp.]|nr:S9 family peptidase [Rudaea sp.]